MKWFARDLRRHQTEAELVLWERLRRRQLSGYKFRRQHPIGPYIADFYCSSEGLVVEVDGEIHDTTARREHDELRDRAMVDFGLKLVRVTNREVFEDIESVLSRIETALHS
jgi:very-short-patch-repair endonuclease